MTSTPKDGESLQQRAEQEALQTQIQDRVVLEDDGNDQAELEYFEQDGADGFTQELPLDTAQLDDTITADELDVMPADDGQELDRIEAVALRVGSPSLDGSTSVPDDTPSLQESGFSSPRSDVLGTQTPVSRKGATPARRPFDLRFQSRLSGSHLISPRASSPAFLATHSRQTSLASFGFQSASEVDDSAAPWEVIRWHKLNRLAGQLFSEASRRNFGSPTCLAVTDQIVVGTSRGLILIFDHQQNHKGIIGSGTRAAESGPVTALAISADHTTVAAGHQTGHIFTWEIGRASRPFLHIPYIDNTQPEGRKIDGHVSGSTVLHIGFLGFRRTALVSADDRGMAFSHLATRGTGSLGRTVRTTRILGRYPEVLTRTVKPAKKSSVLAFAPLPLGNIEKSTDSLGLVAMLTPYLLVIVSTTPVAQTQHKAARPKDVMAHSAMTAALAWFPAIKLKAAESLTSRSKLCYAWSDVLTVLEIHEVPLENEVEKEKPPELQFVARSRYKADEAIVAVQWLSRSVIAVLTITQQLLIIEDVTMTVTDSFDLLPKDLYHFDAYSHQLQAIIETHDEEDASMHGVVADAYHMSFRAYKGRLFLLGFKGLWWGSLTNWADRLLAMIDVGDFIGAVRLATTYYSGVGEKLTIGLPEDDEMRAHLVHDKLLEIMSASLKYAFGRNQIAGTKAVGETQLMDLAVACMAACLSIDNQEFLFDEVFPWYEDHGRGSVFADVLEPYILDGKITSLPPTVLKTLVNHFKTTHISSELEEIICLLDPRAMDIDQVTNLCRQHGLYDAYIYVWNTALMDYVGPLQELLTMVTTEHDMSGRKTSSHNITETSQKMFAYISFTLTGRIYPSGLLMEDELASQAKLQIYDYLFSGNSIDAKNPIPAVLRQTNDTESFASLRTILSFDSSSFMVAMNEAFEDSFLNSTLDEDTNGSPNGAARSSIYTRQLVVQILLGVMSTGFDASDTIYLDMFIARNLPKYPQYMMFKGSTLQQTLLRLCNYGDEDLRDDAQLSAEYLLSMYRPSDVLSLVSMLRSAQFYRVLKFVFRQEQRFADLIATYFVDEDDQDGVFEVVVDCLREQSPLSSDQKEEVIKVVDHHSSEFMDISPMRTALMVDQALPQAHTAFVEAQTDRPRLQFDYLRTILEPTQSTTSVPSTTANPFLLQLYVRLMCQYEPAHVVEFVKVVKENDLELEAVIPAMEASGVIDAAVILLARQGQVQEAIDRLIKHIGTLQAALKGLLESGQESPDVVNTNEAIEDLLDSIDRYSGVGTWICQGQGKGGRWKKSTVKSPRRMSTSPALSREESVWVELLTAVVAIAQDTSNTLPGVQADAEDEVQLSLRNTVQKTFTALLTTTTAAREGASTGSDFTFLRILRAFLTRAATSSPSLSALRSVIASIFSAYAYETSILSLSNSMLDKDLFVHVDEVAQLRQQGWRPRGQVCEICRRRAWGPGIGPKIWKSWKKREEQRTGERNPAVAPSSSDDADMSRGKGKAAAVASGLSAVVDEQADGSSIVEDVPDTLVVFSCRHLYHQGCLLQGQSRDRGASLNQTAENVRLQCPVCP